jgi:hypothetical protein
MTKTALTLRGVSRSFGGGADPVVAMSDVDLTLSSG